MTFFAGADHIEERVVDAHGHSDQEDDRLHAVVERECLADKPEQSERRYDRRQREQNRHESRDDGSERKEDDQRDGDREQLGTVQVVRHDSVSCVARRDVPRFLDRHLGMGRSGGQDRAPKRSQRVEAPDDAGDQTAWRSGET